MAGDVGLARMMDASHLSTGIAPCGTFAYAAPELLMGTRCDEKVRWQAPSSLWLDEQRLFVARAAFLGSTHCVHG